MRGEMKVDIVVDLSRVIGPTFFRWVVGRTVLASRSACVAYSKDVRLAEVLESFPHLASLKAGTKTGLSHCPSSLHCACDANESHTKLVRLRGGVRKEGISWRHHAILPVFTSRCKRQAFCSCNGIALIVNSSSATAMCSGVQGDCEFHLSNNRRRSRRPFAGVFGGRASFANRRSGHPHKR